MTLNTLILGAYSLPVFWLGLILIMILSLQIPLFPTGGIIDVSVAISGNIIDKILNILWHMVLPIFTLSIIYMATYARVTRSVVMDVMKSNFIKAAIARGVPYKRILYVYALKNALIPVIAVAGAQFGLVVAGAVLTETVYSWPGIGTLLVQAVNYRDYPLVIGVLILVGISVAISNFVADLLMARIDPRIKSRLMG
jgi:peptide/nickel transport system permease protein